MRIKKHDIKVSEIQSLFIADYGEVRGLEGCIYKKKHLLTVRMEHDNNPENWTQPCFVFKNRFNRNWAVIRILITHLIKFGYFPTFSYTKRNAKNKWVKWYGFGGIFLGKTKV